MRFGQLSTRALATILPIGLLLFGLSTWLAYGEARNREIGAALSLLREDRSLAQQGLQVRFEEMESAQAAAAKRLNSEIDAGGLATAEFNRLFPARPDGTRRSADSLWTGTMTPRGPASGFGGFIPAQDLSSERRVTVSSAFATLAGVVDGLPQQNVDNLYFFSPDNDLVMYAPGRADNLQFYRRDAPATLDFQGEEFSEIVKPGANPDGVMRCTGLQPILYDESRTTWTTGCMTPVRDGARHIGAFGTSIVLDSIFDDEGALPPQGVERMVVTGDGKLIRHPRYTVQSSEQTGAFLDLATTSEPELGAVWSLLSVLERRTALTFLEDADLYVAAARLDNPDWFIVSAIPGQQVRAAAFESALPILIGGLLTTAAFALFIIWFVRNSLSRPLEQLADRADAIALAEKNSEPVDGADGDELARLDRAFDAMESRVTRERLRLTQSFDLLVDALEEYAVLLLDAEGRITRANSAAKDVFGWDGAKDEGIAQIIGNSDGNGNRLEQARDLLAKVAQDGRVSHSVERVNGHGQTFWAYEAIEAITMEDGNLSGFAYIARDITSQKEGEAALMAARDEAQSAADIRKNLLATVSHEIRTPMTGILGMLEQVRQDNSARQRDRALATIESSAEALMRVLDDVLSTARGESGALQIEERAFDTHDMVQRGGELFGPLARGKGVELILEPGPREMLMGDEARIQQILANFLSNAIKFTAQGQVAVRCETRADKKPDTPDAVTMALSVSDSGIGIPASRLDALFTPFEQVDASTERLFGGTGLGLSICRNLAHAMGGEISVTSVEGEGSTFTLEIPLRRAADSGDALPGTGLRALVVGGSAVARLAGEASLEELGYAVASSANADVTAPDVLYDLVLQLDPAQRLPAGLAGARAITMHDMPTPGALRQMLLEA